MAGARLAVSLAALFTWGCHGRPPRPPPKPGPREVVHSAQCDRASTENEVFIGLYSIYYRAAHSSVTGQKLGNWGPAPLETAAHYLRCDPDHHRQLYRIRYAAIKLAASLVILQRSSAPERLEFVDALKVLGISESLVEQLAKSSSQTLGELEDDAGHIIDSKPADDPLAALQRTCCPCLDSCRSGTADGGVAVVEFTINVMNREAQCLAHVVDPQCWKKVVPLGFNADPQVVVGPACTSSTPPDPTCRNTQTCNDPLPPAPTPLTIPPTPATPWCGLLFEDVAIAGSGVTANMKNVLGVRTTQTPSQHLYQMDYKLCETREWSVTSDTPPSSGNCSIELDCGRASVGDTGPMTGNANLSGTKRIRFTSTFPNSANSWAPIALEVLATETATAACVPSSSCPAASLPMTCASTTQGSTSEAECMCDRGPDHCDGPFDTFNPTYDAPLCTPTPR